MLTLEHRFYTGFLHQILFMSAFTVFSRPLSYHLLLKTILLSLLTNLAVAHPLSDDNIPSTKHGFWSLPVAGEPISMAELRTVAFRNDTIINPLPSDSSRVIISNGSAGIEFSPVSLQNNGGALIQPLNRSTNRGISTAFYLTDSANWSFYTNAQQRLIINSDGRIIANSSLLINQTAPGADALRVNGRARFDSSIFLVGRPDSSSFISFNTTTLRAATQPDDGISPYTTTPTEWAQGQSLPVFRLRHPLSVAGHQPGLNTSIRRDFMILPYEFGTVIEYNGVVECWVGGWSIHRGLAYVDVEGKGNGWGAVLWVGDDHDLGGVRATSRDNLMAGGNVNYGEISVEKFEGGPHGDLRFRLPSSQNEFHFIYGEKGSNNVIAKVNVNGLVIPGVRTVAGVAAPQKAQIAYDSADNKFKGFNGTSWMELGTSLITGKAAASANGAQLVYAIPHGQMKPPTYFNVVATSAAAANIGFVTVDLNSIVIHYTVPPPAGAENLSWNWQINR
jgi:hypothetical protein